MAQQGFSFRGKLYPFGTADEQADAELLFQYFDGLADRRLGDIEILGFKDSDIAQYGLQHMSLICQPTKELGRTAGLEIVNLIDDPSRPVTSIVLNATFMQREDIIQ